MRCPRFASSILVLVVALLSAPCLLAQTGSWALETSSPGWSARSYHGSGVLNGRIWILGGNDGARCNDVWSSSDGINWKLETASAAWSARSDFATAVFNNRLWVLGGSDGSLKNDVWSSADGVNWTLETAAAGWSARVTHSAQAFQNKLWVLGGGNGSEVWSSPDGVSWTQETAAAGWQGYYGASAVYNGKLWATGGGSGNSEVWSSPDGANWTLETSGAAWPARSRHTCIAFANELWVLGGWNSTGYLGDAWHSTDGVSWTQQTSSPMWTGRRRHTSEVFNNHVWMLGGRTSSSNVSEVWSYGSLAIATQSQLPAGTAGTAYSTTFSAAGGTPAYSWYEGTPTGGTLLPSGWSLNQATGELTAASPTAGTYGFDIYVSDSTATTATAPFTVTINAAPTPLNITTSSLPGGTAGVAYIQTLAATGGTPAYSWFEGLPAGGGNALPTGWTLNQTTGEISAASPIAGVYNFDVYVSDSAAATDTANFSVTISAAGTPLSITTVGLPGGTVGAAYSVQIDATGGSGGYSWAVIAGSLPPGLALLSGSPSSQINGTPSLDGSYNFTLEVDDGGATAQQSLSIQIAAGGSIGNTSGGGSAGGGGGCAAGNGGATLGLMVLWPLLLALCVAGKRREVGSTR